MSVRLAILHINTRPQRGVLEHPMPSIAMTCQAYNAFMQKHNNERPPELESYLALCQRTYERMVQDGTWLWPIEETAPDSHDSEDVLDSGHTSKSV